MMIQNDPSMNDRDAAIDALELSPSECDGGLSFLPLHPEELPEVQLQRFLLDLKKVIALEQDHYRRQLLINLVDILLTASGNRIEE
jgi:hypothetical protein